MLRTGVPRTKVLALILAGGKGSRLEVLTEQRAKPVLPFGGVYHLIDIPLSNLANSGLSDVFISEQYQPHSLNDHLANGRPWDLDRTRGGLQVLPPFSGGEGEGFAEGNAEAVYHQRAFLKASGAEHILILSADHLYKLDYRDVLERHLETGAALTLVATRTEQDASRFSVIETDNSSRVTDFAYKPSNPKTNLVAAEIFLYKADALLDTLQVLHEEDDVLGDYGDRLLPRLVDEGDVYALEHEGYWRDLGTPESYWQAHMDLLDDAPEFTLEEPDWPLLTRGGYHAPARIYKEATIDNSLISAGCTVRGKVMRSVLAPGVVVEAGAVVENAVVLENVRLEPDCCVRYAVLDKGVKVGSSAQLNGREDELILVGQDREVEAGTKIEPGRRLEPKG